MRRRLILIVAFIVAFVAVPRAVAVGTVTIVEEVFGSVKKVGFVWTSDAAGVVSGTLTTKVYNGEILRFVTDPSATAPTALYDVTILDDDGTDVLMGAGADRSATVTEQVLASSLGVVANDHLELRIANAGNAKGGTVWLYLR